MMIGRFTFTAVDIPSKYLISIPLANKDTITVTSGLTQIFTKHSVCNTIISNRGTEFTSVCIPKIIWCILHLQTD
jgi:IS30 family transposase